MSLSHRQGKQISGRVGSGDDEEGRKKLFKLIVGFLLDKSPPKRTFTGELPAHFRRRGGFLSLEIERLFMRNIL
jgi:hypothetical protein